MHKNITHALTEMSRTTCPRRSRSKVNPRGGDWDCVRQMQMFRHRPDADEEGVGGDDCADALRYLVATKSRTVTQRKLRGL